MTQPATDNAILKNGDQFLLDAYSGKGGFATGQYLVAHVREQEPEYLRRRQLAIYPNFCRKIIDVFMGYLWKQAPQRTDLSADYVAFAANANGTGTHLDAVLANYQRLATILGTVYIIVDKSPEQATSKADEKMPYITVRLPAQLIREIKNAKGEWDSVTFSETINNVLFYRTFTRTGWTVSQDIDGNGATSGSYTLGRVPVVKLHAAQPLEPHLSRSDSFFYDLAQLNWNLYNLHSELRELLRDQTFAILTFPVSNDADIERLNNLTIGTKNGLVYSAQGSAKPEFIAPPPDSVELYMKYIAETVQDIYRIANLEFVGGVQQSGVALSFHFQEANSSLRTLAEQCETAEREIMALVSAWQGQPPSGYVAYNNDFNLSDIAQTLATALDSVTLGLGAEFDKVLKKRVAKQILGNDVAPEVISAIETEIDAMGDVYGDRVAQQAGL